jgi:formate-nitrite transporter family protein
MKNVPLLIGTIVATLGLVVGIVFFFSKATQPQQAVDPVSLIPDKAHSKGPDNAVVTIVEFSDFQCPACKATQPLLDQILTQYPDKVRLVYRHYPLYSIHKYADLGARAAEAAAEDNKFWEYHDLLFDRQGEWSVLSNETEVQDKLGAYAEELGIDKAIFLERIQSDRIKSLVTQDVAKGGQLNIQATPTLFVNGQPTSAPQLLAEVESRINN